MRLFSRKRRPPSDSQQQAVATTELIGPDLLRLDNHPFAPGQVVGVFPSWKVDMERQAGRAPISAPTVTGEVDDEGTLVIAGLPAGLWTAAAEVNGSWRYVAFPVSV